jgi:hypothetical protein
MKRTKEAPESDPGIVGSEEAPDMATDTEPATGNEVAAPTAVPALVGAAETPRHVNVAEGEFVPIMGMVSHKIESIADHTGQTQQISVTTPGLVMIPQPKAQPAPQPEQPTPPPPEPAPEAGE